MSSTAQTLFFDAFYPGRPPRSQAYRNGVLAALRFRLGETDRVRCTYQNGSAEQDAFFAGTEEGHRIGRDHINSRARGAEAEA